MWNPFNKITRSSISEAVGIIKPIPIQLKIIAVMEGMIDALNVEVVQVPQKQILPVPEEVKALITAGFTSHKKVVAFRKQQKVLDDDYKAKYKVYEEQSNNLNALKSALKFLIRARKVYGPDTLLMPIDQFMNICKKYNLVCGALSDYTGEVPYEKLQEIVRISSICSIHDYVYKVDKIIKTGFGGSSSSAEYAEFYKHFNKDFPFFKHFEGGVVPHVKFMDGHSAKFFHMEFEGNAQYYFIAAPKEMMSGKVQEVYNPKKDPIVWGLKGNNVLIFTRWGEEANDEVIRRCEAFNQKLDAFAESLK